MAFANAQNPFFVNCSFTDHVGNINSYQNSSMAALQILWAAIASGAAYNSEERYPHPRCLPRTRVDSIQNIKDWAESGSSSILWLHGPAGSGKSAVAQTMCETWAKAGLLLASFFFSGTVLTRNALDRFIPTLAYQSVQMLVDHLEPILSVIKKNPQILGLNIQTQLKELFIDPIRDIIAEKQEQKHPCFIIIDAVDECAGNENQLRLLSALLSLVDPKYGLPIRLLIVSRPEVHIRHAFDNLLKPVSTVESLYGSIEDVYKYLEFKFNEIHDSQKHADAMQHIPKPWPGEEVLRELTKRSGGYFIYAATVVRHVDEEGYICTDRLEEVLNRSSQAPGSYPYRELDKVYSQVLSTARDIRCLKRILGCIIVGRRALVRYDSIATDVYTSTIINTLFSFRPGELKVALRGLHSIINLSARDIDDIQFYHASFSDYLVDKERSEVYYINYEATVQDMYTSSLGLIWLPTAANPFYPDCGWAVATSIWCKLGLPIDSFMTHLHGNNGQALELLRPLIDQSQSWAEDLQFRIICLLCAMMYLLKDHPSQQETLDKLTTLCQSALALYLVPENPMVSLESIQDLRTLAETSRFRQEIHLYEITMMKGLLMHSPINAPCIDRLLSYLSHARNPIFHWTQLSTITDPEGELQKGAIPMLGQTLEHFLDDKAIWGDTCEKTGRVARLQKHFANFLRLTEPLHGRPIPLKASAHGSAIIP